MNIFHKLAKQDTQDYLANSSELLRLVAELCQHFHIKVLDHPRDGDLQKILLVEENGVPFGIASVCINSKGVMSYRLQAPFIEKERGRGSDRSARASVKLPALMKLLAKDTESNYEPSINRFMTRIPEVIKDAVSSVVGQDRYSRDIGNDATKALINFFTAQEMITDPVILKSIDEYIVRTKEHDEKKSQLKSKLDEFKTDLHLIMECDNHTFLAGTVKYNAIESKYSLHDDLNCYINIEDLEQTQPQLMLLYKMFQVGTENKVDFKGNIVPRKDTYFPDFDVVLHYFLSTEVPSTQQMYRGESSTAVRMFLTPKLG